MKRILYYCLVDWNWIKQRPQFIALGLAEDEYVVHVVYLYQYRRNILSSVEPGNVCLRPIYRIPPYGYKFDLINNINKRLVRYSVEQEIRRFKPDIIWLTHPSQVEDIPETFRGRIVYDCMDNYDMLGLDAAACELACKQERILCDRSDLILVSSSFLQEKICSRYPQKADHVHLVRNGCNGKLCPRVTGTHGNKLYAGYVGTIAEWFDFGLILESLERIPDLEYFLIGPMCVPDPPTHDRIHYIGPVAQKDLFDKIRDMDCLIMPFHLNDIVLAVDPVKLYEYISWQKTIIAVDYSEIQRFGDLVWRYTDADAYCTLLEQVQTSRTVNYSEEDAARFLSDNTWDSRVEAIRQKLRETGVTQI